MVQWLRLCTPNTGGPGSIPGQGTRCHMLQLRVRMKVKATVRWTVAHQAPLSMEFSWQEYWSGSSFPSPGDLPDPGIKPVSPALQADSVLSEPPEKPQRVHMPRATTKDPVCNN